MHRPLKTLLSLCLFGIPLIVFNQILLEYHAEDRVLNTDRKKYGYKVTHKTRNIRFKAYRKHRDSSTGHNNVSDNTNRDSAIRNVKTTDNYLEMVLPTYLPNYKNPCFLEDARRLRCLPYFQIVGNDKCGTTDLYYRLLQHPQVVPNDGILGKETYFWGWHLYGRHLKQEFPVGHFRRYLKHFDGAVNIIRDKVDTNTSYHSTVIGDGTPVTFWDLGGWPRIPQNRGLREPKYLTPHILKHILPQCKLIVLFRNPTERTYTDYHFLNYLRNSTRESFHRDVITSLKLFWECTKLHSIRMCALDWDLLDKLPVRIHVSLYSLHLTEWLTVYKREEILILRTEDYEGDIAGTINKTIHYLQLQPLTASQLKAIAAPEKKHRTERRYQAGEMLELTRKILDNFYSPFNEELASMLNDTRFAWR